jgi:hypothetical protein
VPLIESHAARLEQLPPERWPVDAEAQARMHRGVQALYGNDAVTVGGGGWLAATACWLAAMPALGISGAREAARAGRELTARPPPPAVAETAAVEVAQDVIRRLRPVLAERSGIALVLPDATRLASQLGRPDDAAWAGEVLSELLRAVGAQEIDLFLFAGDDPPDATLESLADFFGAALVSVGRSAPPGVVALAPNDFPLADSAGGRLYTTTAEIDPGTDPHALRSAIERLRSPHGR